MLVVWKVDRVGRNLAHLVNTVQGPVGPRRGSCGCSLAKACRSTPRRRPVASCSASSRRWAEFERELIRERTVAGLDARGLAAGRAAGSFALSKAQVRLAQAAMAHRDTSVSELCRELGIRQWTLYRYVDPQGRLREQGRKVLGS